MKKIFLRIFCLSAALVFTSCVTLFNPVYTEQEEALLFPTSSYIPETFEWEEAAPGVMRFDFCNSEFPLIYHIVKIDLDGADENELFVECVQGVRTAEFAEQCELTVAVNATPFTKSGTLVGLHKENGVMVAEPVSRYAAIGFRVDESGVPEGRELGKVLGDGASGELNTSGRVTSARIFYSQSSPELDDFQFAFGGFFTVLERGEVRRDFVRRGDSRSGAGVSADGKTLYILVVEGERKSKSRGLSYPQCGEIFKALGCCDALEFDGGGSSELCINGKSVLSYKVRRVQANSFGFKVK